MTIGDLSHNLRGRKTIEREYLISREKHLPVPNLSDFRVAGNVKYW